MKTKETIYRNIEKTLNIKDQTEKEIFFDNAKRYIKAIKQGRMICNIETVSKSGMSRTLKFLECSGNNKQGFRYYNFYRFFASLGYSKVKNSNTFRINGCGMDMVFHTNYSNIRNLYSLGFLTKEQAEILEQKTPTII